jgi:hypothetical protein
MSNDLDEKFVEKSGGVGVPAAEVADTVTPAGGEIKKKKADVKKSVDPKADKVDSATPGQGAVAEEIDFEISESIASMFEGMDLSEEFTSKVTMVFEAAVNEAASVKAEAIIAEQTEILELQMNESVDAAIEKVVENLDTYLDYVVEEWMKENELAIESGVQVEMAESLMDGLRSLFEEHNIVVDEETIDVVAALEEEAADLKATANEQINENVELRAQIASLKAENVFSEMTEDLTITQRERLKVLSEKLDFSDIAEYKADLQTLRESFFKSKKIVAEEVSDEEQEIMTEETVVAKPASNYSSINALVESLNSRTKTNQ